MTQAQGLFGRLKKEIDVGKKGGNRGLSIGLPKLSYMLNGLQRKCLYTVFAPEGVGKSSFVLSSFCMYPYEDCAKNNFQFRDLHIRIYSLEVDSVSLMAKMVSWKIFHDEGTITSPTQILSRQETIPSYVEAKVDSLESYFNEFEKRVTVIDKPMTASDIKDDLEKFARSRGNFYTDSSTGTLRYRPNNYNEQIIVIVDTLTNLKTQAADGRNDKKGAIDAHSALSRDFYRNMLGYSVINVMHSNRQLADIQRAKHGEIFPNKEDLMYSSQPSQDSEVVIALFNPLDYANDNNGLLKFMGYKIDQMNNRMIAAGILKNRYGGKNARVGLLFIHEASYFRELKKATEMADEHYEFIASLNISINQNTPTS